MTTPDLSPAPATDSADSVDGGRVVAPPSQPARERPGAVAPSAATPLGGVRELAHRLALDLDAAQAAVEQRIAECQAQRAHLAERLEHAEVVRRHVLNNLQRLHADEVDAAVSAAAALRGAHAAAEERILELGGRFAELRGEAEGLRTVQRALDDLADIEGTSAADSVARFRSASRQVFQIIEEERMRIARDMHDGPAQSMANLVLQAEVLERLVLRDPVAVQGELAEFKEGVRSALEETRRLIFDLRPMTLDDLGLVPTLRKFVREYAQKAGLDGGFHLVGEERRLPPNCEAVIFRIVQEALANVRKHARARSADVTLTLQARRVVAVVRDDGEGFDVAATEARQGRTRQLGLISMRERADLERGNLEVRSETGRGTEVRVTFDL